jgi:hypothetical protein
MALDARSWLEAILAKMKTTQYFEYLRKRPDSPQIKEDWIKSVIKKPAKIEA